MRLKDEMKWFRYQEYTWIAEKILDLIAHLEVGEQIMMLESMKLMAHEVMLAKAKRQKLGERMAETVVEAVKERRRRRKNPFVE